MAECEPDDRWRGRLDLALTAYRQAGEPVAAAEAKLDALGKADARVRLLDTVPGLGPRTAEAVVAHLDDPARFRNGRQVGAYGGLVPRPFQSGEDDRRGRITKPGPAVLRKLLVQCAWCMLRYDRWARTVFDHLRTLAGVVEGVRKLKAERDRAKAERAKIDAQTRPTLDVQRAVDEITGRVQRLTDLLDTGSPADVRAVLQSLISRVVLHFDRQPPKWEGGRVRNTFRGGDIHLIPLDEGSAQTADSSSHGRWCARRAP